MTEVWRLHSLKHHLDICASVREIRHAAMGQLFRLEIRWEQKGELLGFKNEEFKTRAELDTASQMMRVRLEAKGWMASHEKENPPQTLES